MIQLLRYQDIDKALWETCLQKAERPLVYAHAWYLDAVCGPNWQALVEVQKDAYVSVFPLPIKKVLGKQMVFQPLFTQQLGLFCTQASQHRSVSEYLSLLPPHFAQVQYQLPQPEVELHLPKNWSARLRPNYELSLAPTYPELYRACATNLKRNLKKAQAAQLNIGRAASFDKLLQLFQNTKGKELGELKAKEYKRLSQLFHNAQQAGVGQLWEVRQQQEVLCIGFFLHDGTRITYLFGASSEKGRQLNAMAFLMDQLIQQEAGSGKTFDFEGSEVPGVAKFYANFGAQPVPYLSLSFQNLPAAYLWTRNVFTSLRKRLR
ncbi:GNAT family N-acetyltransferase [Rufibacter roseus]|uniref:GNAT family N-acetyltransferase n=1 Tax=Rufibacter roseus TaxID=1567108 RepID=A0ABW2DE80_9BACT|nr:GNAT family N-acetyltransferase [Rufibacter roseus]